MQTESQKKQPQNLETIKISEYSNRFELELNYKNSLHYKKLIIQKNGYIYEADLEEKITQFVQDPGQQQKSQIKEKSQITNANEKPKQVYKFSAFLGIQHIANQAFLFGCITAIHVCTLERHDIFQIDKCFLIPFNDFSNDEETKAKFGPHMQNIRDLFQEGYYFSYTYDLTLSRVKLAESQPTQIEFCWNRQMYRQLWDTRIDRKWTIPLIQGYVGYFNTYIEGKKLDFCLVARRSSYKAGTRFNARGLDDNGYVANYVEIEEIIFYGNYCCSSLQIRGSVPLFWQQRGVTTQTRINRTLDLTTPAYLKHMEYMRKNYQHVISVNLMKKSKHDEQVITESYEKMIQKQNLSYYKYMYFDLHHVCKGDRYDKINPEIRKLNEQLDNFKFYIEDMKQNTVKMRQKGIIRTNCLDCLDRTNMFQTKIGLEIFHLMMKTFKVDLTKVFGEPPLEHMDNNKMQENHPFMMNFKTVWALCGDMISKHYTGTGSTHTDVTLRGERDLMGRFGHGITSLSRFWIMNFYDNIKQEAIDMVVGEYTHTSNELEEKINEKLKERQSEFTKTDKISVYITTYNLNGYDCPKQDNTEVFNFKANFEEKGNPDIVIIGFQEIDNSYIKGDTTKLIQKWTDFILKQLNKLDNYLLTKQKDYLGCLTLIFNKVALANRIKEINYDTQTLGYKYFTLSNNKGAVSIKFTLDDSTFCFMNCYLENSQSGRVSNINEIHTLGFQKQAVGKLKDKKVEDYDYKFLFGDLQHSIKLDQKTIETYIASYDNAKRQKQVTKSEDILNELFRYDESKIDAEQSEYLKFYQEQPIKFLPTYKYSQHSGIYDKKSTPAWKDRIFYWAGEDQIEPVYYKRNEVRFSNHRPVTGYFICKVNQFDEEVKKQIQQEIGQQLEREFQNIEQNLDEYEKKQIPRSSQIEQDIKESELLEQNQKEN